MHDPSSRSSRDPVLDPQQLDVAAVGLHVGPHAVEPLLHPLLERHRVEVVDQHQAGHDPVLGQLRAQRLRAVLGDRLEDARQALPVEVHERARELLGVTARLHPGGELLDASDEGFRFGAQHSPVGVCTTFRTLPLPVYMCTPHGRHGSNEWTARMMSTPLKLSGPFSSKIGVFSTASS